MMKRRGFSIDGCEGKLMEHFVLDAYCGLYCGACEILSAYRESLLTMRMPVWNDLPKRFSKYIKPAEIKCHGCKSGVVFEGCGGCGIRKCARERQVDFCFECGEYPCSRIDEMRANIEKFKKILPHTGAIVNDLPEIQRQGKAVWLENQRQYWSCEKCGAPVTWYQKRCKSCGGRVGRFRW